MLHAHRLVVGTITVVVVLFAAGGLALAQAGTGSTSADHGILGPGRVTVRIEIEHSHFEIRRPRTGPIRVRPHTEVRFVMVNHDPIGHELIVGGPDVQARHANGHEAYHPPVPGEVSIPADGRASTTYTFHEPGPVEYACHLPGHYQYGMHGIVEVVADGPPR
jgi:plastocyanin